MLGEGEEDQHLLRRLEIQIHSPMVEKSHNVLVFHNFTQICIYPVHNPKSLLNRLLFQFLFKDMFEVLLTMQLPKDLIRGRSPRDEPLSVFLTCASE